MTKIQRSDDVDFKCKICGKDLNRAEAHKLKTPVPISEWDKRNGWKREEIVICCGRIRLVNPNNGTLSSYPIPVGEEWR